MSSAETPPASGNWLPFSPSRQELTQTDTRRAHILLVSCQNPPAPSWKSFIRNSAYCVGMRVTSFSLAFPNAVGCICEGKVVQKIRYRVTVCVRGFVGKRVSVTRTVHNFPFVCKGPEISVDGRACKLSNYHPPSSRWRSVRSPIPDCERFSSVQC